jgi:hypothetical protein
VARALSVRGGDSAGEREEEGAADLGEEEGAADPGGH